MEGEEEVRERESLPFSVLSFSKREEREKREEEEEKTHLFQTTPSIPNQTTNTGGNADNDAGEGWDDRILVEAVLPLLRGLAEKATAAATGRARPASPPEEGREETSSSADGSSEGKTDASAAPFDAREHLARRFGLRGWFRSQGVVSGEEAMLQMEEDENAKSAAAAPAAAAAASSRRRRRSSPSSSTSSISTSSRLPAVAEEEEEEEEEQEEEVVRDFGGEVFFFLVPLFRAKETNGDEEEKNLNPFFSLSL